MTMTEMIAADGLLKVFGHKTAVAGVSLSVQRGEVLGFLGPNGAGKSTTMKMIAGFLRPTAGTARICGFDVLAKPIEAKRRLGYLPEGAPLYPDMTPISFLRFIADIRGLSGDHRRRRLAEAIGRTHIDDVLMQPIETLSKGFKRRVGLAQALLHDPEVLILDEPTDGLDPNQKHEVRSLIREIAPEKAIIISTHILEEVEAICSRVVADGSPTELIRRSRLHNAVTIALPAAQADQAETALRSLPNVATVDRMVESGGLVRLSVIPREHAPIYASVAQLANAHGWPLADLRAETGHLDDVFRTITMPAVSTPAEPREAIDA
jgi:ABC-2 type transport system ATP-binding protein